MVARQLEKTGEYCFGHRYYREDSKNLWASNLSRRLSEPRDSLTQFFNCVSACFLLTKKHQLFYCLGILPALLIMCGVNSASTDWFFCSVQVLCLHLKRFRYSPHGRTKVDTFVRFPITDLNMNPYLLKSVQVSGMKTIGGLVCCLFVWNCALNFMPSLHQWDKIHLIHYEIAYPTGTRLNTIHFSEHIQGFSWAWLLCYIFLHK